MSGPADSRKAVTTLGVFTGTGRRRPGISVSASHSSSEAKPILCLVLSSAHTDSGVSRRSRCVWSYVGRRLKNRCDAQGPTCLDVSTGWSQSFGFKRDPTAASPPAGKTLWLLNHDAPRKRGQPRHCSAAVSANSDITLVYVPLGLWSYRAVEQLRDAFVRSEERFNEQRAKVNTMWIFLRGICAKSVWQQPEVCARLSVYIKRCLITLSIMQNSFTLLFLWHAGKHSWWSFYFWFVSISEKFFLTFDLFIAFGLVNVNLSHSGHLFCVCLL